jgi:hypothetical protein
MAKKIDVDDYLDVDESDESYDYFEKIYHKRHSAKKRIDARRKLERFQENQALNRLMNDDIYDWE